MIINANSVHIPLPDNSVQCVVTSPPYWGLRKYEGEQDNIWGGDADCQHEWGAEQRGRQYGRADTNDPTSTNFGGWGNWDGATGDSAGNFCQRCGAWRGGLGLEPTPEMFIDHMVQIFQEVKRVLRADGVAWVNMGDSYHSHVWGGGKNHFKDPKRGKHASTYSGGIQHNKPRTNTLKQKDLGMIPHRLALALQADGWWVRSDVIWAKPNPMPESVNGWRWEQCKDCAGCDKCRDNDGLVLRRGSWRPTSSHEHLFMLAKSSMYYSDGENVKEPDSNKSSGNGYTRPHRLTNFHSNEQRWQGGNGRNLRNVWNIATAPYKGAHYATFPPELARKCVLSSTSRHACSECGMAWTRVVQRVPSNWQERKMAGAGSVTNAENPRQHTFGDGSAGTTLPTYQATTLYHRPSCQCDADTKPCLVLDPFAGSGTVGQACRELPYQRNFVGLDISYEYLHGQALLRSERITTEASLQELPMFADDNGGK